MIKKVLKKCEVWYKSFTAAALAVIMMCMMAVPAKAETPYIYQGVVSPEIAVAFTKVIDETYQRLHVTPLGMPPGNPAFLSAAYLPPEQVFATCSLIDFEGDNIPELFFAYPLECDGNLEEWQFKEWCYEVWRWDGTKAVCLVKENIPNIGGYFDMFFKCIDGKICFYFFQMGDYNLKIYGIKDKKWEQVKYFQGNVFWGDPSNFGDLPPMIDGKIMSLDSYIKEVNNWFDDSEKIIGKKTFDISDSYNLYHQLSARYAVPSNVKLKIDGKYYSLDVFNIENQNYFKVRDIAKLLVGTSKEAYIEEDSTSIHIGIDMGDFPANKYLSNGTELKRSNLKPTVLNRYISDCYSSNTIGMDFSHAYKYQNNAFFSIQDLGFLFDFQVGWDNATKTIVIDTTKSYFD